MANTFYRKTSSNVGTTATTIGGYTVPGATTTVIVGLSMANDTGATINASAFIANATALTYLVKNAPITTGGTLVIVGGDQKIVLQPTDNVKVVSDTASSLDAVMSIMEIT
jgi:bifunctional ADP-heptose synthase (sugar kinase/adenylyltransferase)